MIDSRAEWPCEDPENEDGDEWDIVFHRNLASALAALRPGRGAA
jgi:hypothetical protein